MMTNMRRVSLPYLECGCHSEKRDSILRHTHMANNPGVGPYNSEWHINTPMILAWWMRKSDRSGNRGTIYPSHSWHPRIKLNNIDSVCSCSSSDWKAPLSQHWHTQSATAATRVSWRLWKTIYCHGNGYYSDLMDNHQKCWGIPWDAFVIEAQWNGPSAVSISRTDSTIDINGTSPFQPPTLCVYMYWQLEVARYLNVVCICSCLQHSRESQVWMGASIVNNRKL